MAEKHNSDIKDCAQTRQPPINTSERRVCIHAASISTSVKRGDTSSSIPHRLDNSSSSTSLLHIKKQCAAWGIEWAVERKQLVSCQGEHPEIISIIYHADTLWRQTRRGVTRTRRRWRKGEARSRVLQIRREKKLFWGFFLVFDECAPHGRLRGCIWINAQISLSVLNMVVSWTLGICVFGRKQETAY